MRSSTVGPASRHLELVRVHAEASASRVERTGRVRARRVVAVSGTYLARGVRLLGAHFTAFAWTTDSGEPEQAHRPRAL